MPPRCTPLVAVVARRVLVLDCPGRGLGLGLSARSLAGALDPRRRTPPRAVVGRRDANVLSNWLPVSLFSFFLLFIETFPPTSLSSLTAFTADSWGLIV